MNDNNGRTHLIGIPISIYVPNLQMTLLCLQHWAQQDAMSHPCSLDGVVCYTMAEATVLEWDQWKFCKIIKHNQTTNTHIFYTSPGVKLYKLFCSQFDAYCTKITPQEVILKTAGATYWWHQREADPEFIVVKDMLVGKDGDWLNMDDGNLANKGSLWRSIA